MNNTIKSWFKYGAFALVVSGLTNCETEITPASIPVEDKTIQELNISPNFDWSMSKAVDFELTAQDNEGEILPNAYVEVYDFDPYTTDALSGAEVFNINSIDPIYSGYTNDAGKIATQLAIGKATQQLFVCPRYPSLHNKYVIDVEGKQTLNFSVGGISINKKSDAVVVAKKLGDNFEYLNTHTTKGVPTNLVVPGDHLDPAFLATVNASLPEGRPVPDYNPEHIQDGVEPNLVLTKEAKVWLTFVHEGAGYKNGVGYYTYPVGEEPQSKSDIEKYYVAFANTSLPHDGKGNLNPGDKVQLKYWNEATGEFEENFPANTVVAWFLVANGWNSNDSDLKTNGRIVYSTPWFNVEKAVDKQRHNVLLLDEARELLLLGFEDLHREEWSDEDFNDAVFYTKVEPFDAVDKDDLAPTNEPDGDPTFNNRVKGTLAFEDLWPAKGDYDFNDLVVDYNINQVTNSNSEVIKLVCNYTVRATGASFHNGFAIQLPIAPSAIKSVTGTTLNGDLDVAANGTENGQTKAVIPFFNDAYDVLPFVGGSFVNTNNDGYYSEPVQRKVVITLTQPIAMAELGLPPYNPFLIINHTDAKRFGEVHLPNYAATDLATTGFGTVDDNSVDGQTYTSKNNLPWALHIPVQFAYPFEKVEITKAYTKFGAWAESAGTLYPDWYSNKSGYRNTSEIYSH